MLINDIAEKVGQSIINAKTGNSEAIFYLVFMGFLLLILLVTVVGLIITSIKMKKYKKEGADK